MRAFADVLSTPLRSGFTVPASLRGDGIKMLNMGELFKYAVIPPVEMARVAAPSGTAERVLLQPEDLMFARRSLSLEGAGKCAIVGDVDEPTTWESSIIRARVDPALAQPRFLYYYFASPQGRRQMETIVEQVAAAGIRLTELAKLPLPDVSLPEQQAIVEVLGALDDKIAANTRLAATADELVRTIVSTPCAETVRISDLFTSPRDGVDPRQLAESTPYVGLEHVPRRSLWLAENGYANAATSTKSMFQCGDVLFGKLRPYFHKVVTAPFDGICSTDILVLRPRAPELAGYATATVSSDAVVAAATASSEGTRMPRASWKDLSAIEVPWPGDEAARKASDEISAIRAAVVALLDENRTLGATRDALLPKLMSGRLRVRDAVKIFEKTGA